MTAPQVLPNGHRLSDDHRTQLFQSGISEAVVAGRGYWTATRNHTAELRHLGHPGTLVEAGDALMLPVWDVFGTNAFTIVRPDRPTIAANGKVRKYLLPRAARVTLDVPPLVRPALANAEIPLWICEGQKKGDAAVSHGARAVIVIAGVWCWRGSALAAWDVVSLRDRTVYLAFDSDAATNPQVAAALRRLRNFLIGKQAVVRVVHLNPGADGEKTGLDDALAAGATLDTLAATATADLRSPRPAIHDNRPVLDVTYLHRHVLAESFAELARHNVYRGSEGLVTIRRRDGVASIERLDTTGALRPVLDRYLRCERHTETKTYPVFPPRDLAELAVNEPEPPVPPLTGLVTAPTFTSEGRYVDAPGYDAESGLFVDLGQFQPRPVSPTPTDEELAEARRLWDEEALKDFPFQSTADRTNAMALALTPLVRSLIPGQAPLIVADASAAGAGKTKLVTVCLLPTLGRDGHRKVPWPKTEEEVRKRLLALLRNQPQAVLFDNVAGYVSSSSFELVLTSAVLDERILGVSESVRVANRCTWALTSNNATLSDEMARRRVVPIRLVPETAHPELRQGFKHPALETWATEHRAALLWALTIFVRHWQARGKPAPSVIPLGSFESWCLIVGGILQAARYEGFLSNREEWNRTADPDSTRWEAFTAAWHRLHRSTLVTARALLPLAALHEVYVAGLTEADQAVSLGKSLARRRDRFFGPFQLKQGEGSDRRSWFLRHVQPVEEPLTGRTGMPRSTAVTTRVGENENTGVRASHATDSGPVIPALPVTAEEDTGENLGDAAEPDLSDPSHPSPSEVDTGERLGDAAEPDHVTPDTYDEVPF